MIAQDFFDLEVLFHREYKSRVYKPRLDPMQLADREFKSHFRFRQEYCEFVKLIVRRKENFLTIPPPFHQCYSIKDSKAKYEAFLL